MRHKTSSDIISATNAQLALGYLVEHPNQEMSVAEIQNATRLSRAGTYRALAELASHGLAVRQKKGRQIFYLVKADDCLARQFKVLRAVQFLRPLVPKLKPVSRKVILFGSTARGEDFPESDIDLFIVVKDPEAVRAIVSGFKSRRKIQAVLKTAVELAHLQATNETFYRELNSGIILWEERDER